MASIIGLLVLFLATLTLGGCAGMPLGLGDVGAAGGYAAPCPQPYGGCAPGYAAPPQAVYVPQPLYAPQPYAYAPAYAPAPPPVIVEGPPPRGPHMAGPWVDRREHEQSMRIRQGVRDGSLTPYEARRLGGEQRHIRGAEARMGADGNINPHERGRLNAMQNRASQDIHRARHNGVGQPGPVGSQHGNGYPGQINSGRQAQSNGPQAHGTHGGMPPQARSVHPGGPPRAEATPGP